MWTDLEKRKRKKKKVYIFIWGTGLLFNFRSGWWQTNVFICCVASLTESPRCRGEIIIIYGYSQCHVPTDGWVRVITSVCFEAAALSLTLSVCLFLSSSSSTSLPEILVGPAFLIAAELINLTLGCYNNLTR